MVIVKIYHKDVQTYFRWYRLIYFHSIDQSKDLKMSERQTKAGNLANLIARSLDRMIA